MLETEAKTKICPVMTGPSSTGDFGLCQGSDCMGWDEYSNHRYEGEGMKRKSVSEPRDPPEGDCGMKPKELECNA